MAEQVNMSKMPRMAFKELVENILIANNVDVVEDGYKTGMLKKVQGMITQMDETYVRPTLNSSTLVSTLNITAEIFSETNSTGVHNAIMAVMAINGTTAGLPTYRLKSIAPISSNTQFINEATEGGVLGTVTLEIVYLM